MTHMKLGDVATFVSGGTPSRSVAEYYGGDIPWITGADINDSGDVSSRFGITTEAVQKSATNIVEAGALVLVTRTSVGKVALLDRATAISQDLTGVVPHAGISSDYIRHFLKFSARSLAVQARGATIKGITRNVVASMMVPVPSLGEQRRIAGILDQADTIRTKRRASLALFDELVDAIYREILYRAGEGFQLMGELVSSTQLGMVRSSKEFGPGLTHGYVRMDAISPSGRFLPDKVQKTEASSSELDKYEVVDGDFLVNTRNSRELVGKAAVVSGLGRATFNNNLLRARFRSGISPEFVAAFLRSGEGRSQVARRVSGTTSVFAFYQRDFLTLQVPAVPVVQQQEFAARVETINAQRALVERALEKDEELFASLQSRAFSGEL